MIVYFLRGLPGAGKSTLARELHGMYRDAGCEVKTCEADDFFMGEDGYKFDGKLLEEAHAACQQRYAQAIAEKLECIIVSNVSARPEHIEWYQQLAEENGYLFFSLIVENRHGNESEHNVPVKSIANMARVFDVKLTTLRDW